MKAVFQKAKALWNQLDPMKRTILSTYFWALTGGGAYYLWGTLTGLWLPCTYYTLFHIQCAGCGMSRMFLKLIELDIPAAFAYNPGMFITLILWNVIAVLCFFNILKSKRVLSVIGTVNLVGLLVFGVLRNFA